MEPRAIRRRSRRVSLARVRLDRVSHSANQRHAVGAWLVASAGRVLRVRRHWVGAQGVAARHVGRRLAVSAASGRRLGLAGGRSRDRRRPHRPHRRRSRWARRLASAAIDAEACQGGAEPVVRVRSLLVASAGHHQGCSQTGHWRYRLADTAACRQRKQARHIEGIRSCRNAHWFRISNTAYHPSQPRLAGIGLIVLLDIPACTTLVQTRGQRGATPFHRITLYTVWRITARHSPYQRMCACVRS